MSLINCPACSNAVSDLAPICPHCGHPLKAIITEQTSKTWKRAMLFGVLSTLGGCGTVIGGATNQSPGTSVSGCLIAIVGLIVFSCARIGAWWNHR